MVSRARAKRYCGWSGELDNEQRNSFGYGRERPSDLYIPSLFDDSARIVGRKPKRFVTL